MDKAKPALVFIDMLNNASLEMMERNMDAEICMGEEVKWQT